MFAAPGSLPVPDVRRSRPIVPAGPPSHATGRHQKTPAVPGEGPSVLRGFGSLAVPLRPSVLPPGAPDEPDEALETEPERAEEYEEREAAARLDRQVDAAAVGRDHDRDVAPILSAEESHVHLRRQPRRSAAASAQSSSERQRVRSATGPMPRLWYPHRPNADTIRPADPSDALKRNLR